MAAEKLLHDATGAALARARKRSRVARITARAPVAQARFRLPSNSLWYTVNVSRLAMRSTARSSLAVAPPGVLAEPFCKLLEKRFACGCVCRIVTGACQVATLANSSAKRTEVEGATRW